MLNRYSLSAAFLFVVCGQYAGSVRMLVLAPRQLGNGIALLANMAGAVVGTMLVATGLIGRAGLRGANAAG